MFQLSRFFGITSGIAFVIVGIALGALFNKLALDDLTRFEGMRNAALVEEVLALSQSIAVSNTGSRWPSSEELQSVWIRDLITSALERTDVVKLQLFDLDGNILFSTEPNELGANVKESVLEYRLAMRGRTVNKLLEAKDSGAFNRTLISSYLPIQFAGAARPAKGVVALHSDVESQLQQIVRTQENVITGVLLILFALFVILFVAVRLADRIIHSQHAARERAEDELRAANDNLEGLVEERTRDLQLELSGRQEIEDELHDGPVFGNSRMC